MRVPILMFLTLLLGSCLDLGQALFFKTFKGLKGGSAYAGYDGGYGAGYSSGYGAGYASNYDYNGGYGYNGYGDYTGGYGDNGGYSGYSQPAYRPRYRQPGRTGRTYSDIARVGRADPHLGLGAVRYIPNAKYSHLWG